MTTSFVNVGSFTLHKWDEDYNESWLWKTLTDFELSGSPIVQQSWDEHRALEATQARKARKQGGTDCNRDSNQWRCSRTTRVNVDSGSLWGTKGCTVLPRVGAEAKRQWGCEPCTVRALLHSALLWALQCLSAPPRDLDTEQDTASPPLCNYLCTPAPPTALWHRSPCEQYICIVIMQCILHSRR